jgi:hypothetical protein
VEVPVATLTKRQVLLHQDGVLRHIGRQDGVTMEYEGMRFAAADGDRRLVVVLDFPTWTDMGEPTEITVTIEPGDTLNG